MDKCYNSVEKSIKGSFSSIAKYDWDSIKKRIAASIVEELLSSLKEPENPNGCEIADLRDYLAERTGQHFLKGA